MNDFKSCKGILFKKIAQIRCSQSCFVWQLGSCTSMTILSLRDNRIVRIPDDIGRMPNLQVMNLACNR